MGWDGLLDALAERDEAGEGDFPRADGPTATATRNCSIPMREDDEEEFIELDDGGLRRRSRITRSRRRPRNWRCGRWMSSSTMRGRKRRPTNWCRPCLQVSGKLAGALNGRGSGYEPETGYVLAVLKRCLNWLNDAVGCCQQLMAAEEDPDQLAALAHLRSSAFAIRDAITELRRELKS